MTWLDAVTDGLATYRITRLIHEDAILEDLREWVWKHHSPEDTKLGYLITCPYCISIWAAAAVALSHTPPDGVFSGTLRVLRNTLALSGAVALLHEALERAG